MCAETMDANMGSHRPRLIVLIRHGESESNKNKSVNQHIPNHLIPLTPHGWEEARNAGVQLLKLLNVDDDEIVEELEKKYTVKNDQRKLLPVVDYKRYNKKKDVNIVFYTSPYRRTRETLKGILEVIDEYNEKNCGVSVCKGHGYEPCKKKQLATWPAGGSTHTNTNGSGGVYANDNSTHHLADKVDDGKSYIAYRVKDDPRIREQDFGNFQEVRSMQDVMEKRQTYGHFFFRFPQGESAADVYDRVASFQETLFRHFNKSSKRRPRDVIVLVTHGIYSRVFLMKWFRWTYEEFESFINVPNGSLMLMELDETIDRYVLRTALPKWC